MRRRRKLYLMTHTKSSMALDELGEVKDPIAAICKWANENLDDREIRRLQVALGRLVDQGEDDGLRALSPMSGDTEGEYPEQDPPWAETKRRLNAGAHEANGGYSRGAQAQDAALAPDVSYDRLFGDTKRLDRRPDIAPIDAGVVQVWIR